MLVGHYTNMPAILQHYTVSQKGPTFKLSVSSSNVNRFSKKLHCWESLWNLLQAVRHYPPHLRHVATQPWEIKNLNFLHIFSRYGRKCKQIAFLIASNFASHSLYWLQTKNFNSLLYLLFTFAINLWHRKYVTADVTADVTAVSLNNQHGKKRRKQDFDKTFIWNHYEERLVILNTEKIKICEWTTKLEATKMRYICISAMSVEYLQKI